MTTTGITKATPPTTNKTKPPKVISDGAGGVTTGSREGAKEIADLLHVSSGIEARDAMTQLAQSARPCKPPLPPADAINEALSTIHGLAPQSRAEAMLALQMHGVHNAQMHFMYKTLRADHPDLMSRYSNAAAKFGNLWIKQAELLLKMQGKTGHQSMTVQHMHLHQEPGAQAMIGPVTQAPKDRGEGRGDHE